MLDRRSRTEPTDPETAGLLRLAHEDPFLVRLTGSDLRKMITQSRLDRVVRELGEPKVLLAANLRAVRC